MSQAILTPDSAVSTTGDSRSPMLAHEQAQDDIFFVLSNYRRRFVLGYLRKHPGPVSLRTLSEELAAWENEVDKNMTTSTQRKRAYVSLRQTHLPKLEELRIISFDSNRGIVEGKEGMETLDPFFGGREEPNRFINRFYIGLGFLGTTLLGMAVAGIFLL